MSACTCGRSPTDNCVGWHNLTEEKYLERKAAHEARKADHFFMLNIFVEPSAGSVNISASNLKR